MGEISVKNVKFHRGTLGHSCRAPEVVTWIMSRQFCAPLKVIRRISQFLRRSRSASEERGNGIARVCMSVCVSQNVQRIHPMQLLA
jgi:hypothetical protein